MDNETLKFYKIKRANIDERRPNICIVKSILSPEDNWDNNLDHRIWSLGGTAYDFDYINGEYSGKVNALKDYLEDKLDFIYSLLVETKNISEYFIEDLDNLCKGYLLELEIVNAIH